MCRRLLKADPRSGITLEGQCLEGGTGSAHHFKRTLGLIAVGTCIVVFTSKPGSHQKGQVQQALVVPNELHAGNTTPCLLHRPCNTNTKHNEDTSPLARLLPGIARLLPGNSWHLHPLKHAAAGRRNNQRKACIQTVIPSKGGRRVTYQRALPQVHPGNSGPSGPVAPAKAGGCPYIGACAAHACCAPERTVTMLYTAAPPAAPTAKRPLGRCYGPISNQPLAMHATPVLQPNKGIPGNCEAGRRRMGRKAGSG